VHVLHCFFSDTVEDDAMTTQRAPMQAASNQEVRSALRPFCWRERSRGFGGIVVSLALCRREWASSAHVGAVGEAVESGRLRVPQGRPASSFCQDARGGNSSGQDLCARSAHADTTGGPQCVGTWSNAREVLLATAVRLTTSLLKGFCLGRGGKDCNVHRFSMCLTSRPL
jgi:hypothetical protein